MTELIVFVVVSLKDVYIFSTFSTYKAALLFIAEKINNTEVIEKLEAVDDDDYDHIDNILSTIDFDYGDYFELLHARMVDY